MILQVPISAGALELTGTSHGRSKISVHITLQVSKECDCVILDTHISVFCMEYYRQKRQKNVIHSSPRNMSWFPQFSKVSPEEFWFIYLLLLMKRIGCGTKTSKHSKILAYSARLHQVAAESNEKAVLVCHFWNFDDALFLSWESFLGLDSGTQRQSCRISHFLDDLESQCRSDQHTVSLLSFCSLTLLFWAELHVIALDNIEYWWLLNFGGTSAHTHSSFKPSWLWRLMEEERPTSIWNSNQDQLFWLHFPCGKNKKPVQKHNHPAGRLEQVSCLQLISHKMWMRFFSVESHTWVWLWLLPFFLFLPFLPMEMWLYPGSGLSHSQLHKAGGKGRPDTPNFQSSGLK